MTTTTNPTRKVPADSTLYFTDNGAILCGRHLGTSAAYTGRDISGQPIERVTPDDSADLLALGVPVGCECCRFLGASHA
jgi:hypothetical protein